MLLADRRIRPVIERITDVQLAVVLPGRRARAASAFVSLHENGMAQFEPFARHSLVDDAGVEQAFGEQAGSNRRSRGVRDHSARQAIVDLQSRQGRHDVFDHLDRHAAAGDRRAPRPRNSV